MKIKVLRQISYKIVLLLAGGNLSFLLPVSGWHLVCFWVYIFQKGRPEKVYSRVENP